MELINIGLGFEEEVMKRILIDKLGVRRYLQVTKEVMARETVPENRDDRTFACLKEETVPSLGTKRKFLNDGESRPCPGVEKFGTSRKFPETVTKILLLKCWGCGGEHRQIDCPERKEKISGRLRSQSKTVSYIEDELSERSEDQT